MLNTVDEVDAEELEQEEKPAPSGVLTRVILWLVVMSVGFMFVSLVLVTTSIQEKNLDLLNERTTLQEEVAVTPAPDPEEEALNMQLSQVRSQVNALASAQDGLTQRFMDWRGAAERISTYDGTKLEITGVVQTENRLVLTGRAADEDNIIEYLDHLETYPGFERIVVQSIALKTVLENEVEYRVAEFSIMVEVKAGQL